MTVAVIVPTIGRPTLQATIESIPDKWGRIIVADGLRAYACASQTLKGHQHTLIGAAKGGVLGHRQRNIGMAATKADWLMFLDDDDVYTPDVASLVTPHLTERRPHIFKMRYTVNGHELWQQPKVAHGNIGTPMFLVPNTPGRVPQWPDQASGDYEFMLRLVELQGPPVFVDKVIAVIRPHDGAV